MKRIMLFLMILFLPHLALADSGRVLYVSGKVTVEREGQAYRAVKGAKIVQGDLIETGASGRLHLRMSDRSLISLKPNTRFQIKTYRFRDTSSARPAALRLPDARQTEDRSVFGLLKGGFRAITGLIGQRNQQAFGVETPVATIGIRGTSFVADLIPVEGGGMAAAEPLMLASRAQDLAQLGLSEPRQSPPAGPGWRLNVGVGQGTVVLRNAQGELVLENGEFGVVEGFNTPPRRRLRPREDSEALPEDDTQTEDEDEDESAELGSSGRTGSQSSRPEDESEEKSREPDDDTEVIANRQVADNSAADNSDFGQNSEQEADELVVPETEVSQSVRDISLVSAFGSPSRGRELQQARADQSRVDEDGHLTAFPAVFGRSETGVLSGRFELIDGTVSNAGFDPRTGMHWGRWSGGAIRLLDSEGNEQILSTAEAQWHQIHSRAQSAEIQLPTSGTAEFELIGNTEPSNQSGELGIFGNASLRADFDTQTVETDLSLSINEQVWEASGTGNLGMGLAGVETPAHLFEGVYDAVSVGGEPGGQGEFSGFITDRASGAGLSYQLENGNSTVQGVAAFGPLSE